MAKDDLYYQALLSRDHRFDGKFFVGVKTTGIYCRAICPAKPLRKNVEFFSSALAAEKAGYRPCMRCRPESAPLSQAWIGKSALVQRALRVLYNEEALDFNEDRFAEQFGVSSRHLRRLFTDEIGKTPKQISFEHRLNLSRKLITETSLPMTEIAFASGFSSVRRFNDAFKDRFKKTPSQFRSAKPNHTPGLRIPISYRPPFDFEGLMKSYENHRIGNLERFEEGKMHRVISFNKKHGEIIISNDPEKCELLVEIDFPETAAIYSIVSKIRSMFDLDSDPIAIANSLELDPKIKSLLKKYPGIRIASGWDPFEISISTILGQLVSVDRGRSLVADLIEIAGQESGLLHQGKFIKLFPTPEQIIDADLNSLKTTQIRKQTLKNFSRAIVDQSISLSPTQDVDQFIKNILSIKGIGPWTAEYIALKALRHTDSFPASDLILARALKEHSSLELNTVSPWKGYVAALFWRHYSSLLKKKRSKK
jgi:AraC family transcriptional regulator, regulatory protein of adaptative response / DNA-3-methyladenine glycosylase II